MRCEQKIMSLKELVRMLREPATHWNDTLIYKNAVLIQFATRFLRSDGTYNQIVNSGSLRYFRNSQLQAEVGFIRRSNRQNQKSNSQGKYFP